MSCGCNSNPCNCQPRPSVCCAPTTESVEYTFENGNLVGVGVFDNETDNLVQFRGIVSDSVALTVTLDAGNNVIVLDFDDSQLVAAIPDATTTQRGIAETATNAEALAKAATDKIVTPSNFAAMGSTTTFAGLVELATEAETIAGASTTLAVTPAGLAAVGATNTLTTWADAVTRAADTPTFDGRVGVQLDTNVPWVANGTGVGDFDVPIYIQGPNTMVVNTTITTTGFAYNFDGTGEVNIAASGGFTVDTDANFFGALTTIGNGGGELLNFEGCSFQVDGFTAGNSVLMGRVGGAASAKPIDEFISTDNVQTGYTGFTNPATIRTLDTSTATLQQVAQCLGTLIEDLKSVLLPAAT